MRLRERYLREVAEADPEVWRNDPAFRAAVHYGLRFGVEWCLAELAEEHVIDVAQKAIEDHHDCVALTHDDYNRHLAEKVLERVRRC